MNSKQAKQLDFPKLLEIMGYVPARGGTKKGGNELWYHSPLNKSDKTPSFHLTKGDHVAWVFTCFSTGAEGTIIDFVIAHEGYASTDAKSALAFLREKFSTPVSKQKVTKRVGGLPLSGSFSLNQQDIAKSISELEFIKAVEIQSPIIFQYLEKRSIPRSLALQYLKEVRYKNRKKDKEYFAFGMENLSGGYEIRAASDEYKFKSAIIKRDISVIKGLNPEKKVINIFEGMTDFLSLLVFLRTERLRGDAMIMHSLSSFNASARFISENRYDLINTFLDNNDAGRKGTGKFSEQFGVQVTPQSHRFMGYTDLNDALNANANLEL